MDEVEGEGGGADDTTGRGKLGPGLATATPLAASILGTRYVFDTVMMAKGG